MRYYEVAIIGHKSPPFSYSSPEILEIGECVCVPLKTKPVKAVIIKEQPKPSFACKMIQERLYHMFTPLQIKLAYFIASYYLCTLGESYQLFTPINASPIIDQAQHQATLKVLSNEQKHAFEGILPLKNALLFGDTGSGKTEIYFHLIHQHLNQGKQVLLLMPEISLTPQMEKRLKQAFGDCLGVWHSKITSSKQKILRKIEQGEIRIIAGARSALFLPLQHLSLIIVDEEHDDAYKSQTTPFYNAKDLALWISTQTPIQTLLGSATPCVSLYHKLKRNTFRLKGGYASSQKQIKFLQGSDEPTPETLNHIQETLNHQQQVMIFLPTRANYKYIICHHCAKILQCEACTLTLSFHEKEQKMSCHHCNYTSPIPQTCPYCDGELILKRIGTMELAKRLETLFPQAQIERLDKDSVSSLKKLHTVLKNFHEHKTDILVGTQMISKGHDYPNVGLVVILGIDYLLKQADYRSPERVIALLLQLCGRSGRMKEGQVIIQTGQQEYFATYLTHYERFLEDELMVRKENYPPFARLAMIHMDDKDHQRLINAHRYVHNFFTHRHHVRILAAGPCDIEKLAHKWRFYILLSSTDTQILHKALIALLQHLEHTQQHIQKILRIDIDPLTFS